MIPLTRCYLRGTTLFGIQVLPSGDECYIPLTSPMITIKDGQLVATKDSVKYVIKSWNKK